MSPDGRAALRTRLAALDPAALARLAQALGERRPERLTAFVVAEGTVTPEELGRVLRSALPDALVPAVTLCAELPRTAAGKVDRAALARRAPEPPSAPASDAPTGPRSATEETLLGIWRDVLGTDEIGVHDDFFEIGGDSLLSIRVLARAGRAGLRLEPETFFRRPTVAALAEALAPDVHRAGSTDPDEDRADPGRAPLTPIQHWFLERIPRGRDRWNQAVAVDVDEPVDGATLGRVVAALVERHDALRLRLVEQDGAWQQDVATALVEPPVQQVGIDASARDDAVAAALDAAQDGLRIDRAPLFRVLEVRDGDAQRLVLVAHHLLVDAVSWGVLLEDLATLLGQARAGEPLALAPRTASLRRWASALTERVAHPDVRATLPRWEEGTPTEAPASAGDTARASAALARDGDDCAADALQVHVHLDAQETTHLLRTQAARLDTTPLELLLAALVHAWRAWTGADTLALELETHGRDAVEGLDVSRTVGWFTSTYPVRLHAPRDQRTPVLDAVRSAMRALPPLASYGLLRFLHPDPATRRRLAGATDARLLFNFLGNTDGDPPGLRRVSLPDVALRSASAPRAYAIEINAWIDAGALHVALEMSQRLHGAEAAHAFAGAWRTALDALATLDPDPFAGRPLAQADLATIGDLLAELDEE